MVFCMMKKENLRRPIALFLLSCVLIAPMFAVVSIPLVMISSVVGLLGSDYGFMIVVYFLWLLMIDFIFYGTDKKQNRYIACLEKNRAYTVSEDFRLFIKQEGAAVMLSYAVYGVLSFVAKTVVPASDNLIVLILRLVYVIPVLPSSMVSWPIWMEYGLGLVCFSVLYCSVIMWRRARIRKKWHS